jgi:NAD(P)-dependent dehydrogenase (short-subunit alcohol dehydrogenase family)
MAERGFVLVTGASRGLGRSLALELAASGFSVFAGVRGTEDGDALRSSSSGDLRPVLLDVTSSEDITSAEAAVRHAIAGGKLTGLVNNAATYLQGPFEQTSEEDVASLFRVNVLGLVAVTQRFVPLLRHSRGRIVNISSANGKLCVPFTSFYSASKFAVEALSDALRFELCPWGIHVAVVEPGATQTDIRARGVEKWTADRASLAPAAAGLYAEPYAVLQHIMARVDEGAADHSHFVEAVVHALVAESPQTRYLAGPDMAQWMAMAALDDRERDAAWAALLGGQGV